MSLRLKLQDIVTVCVCYYLAHYCYVMKRRKKRRQALLSDINHKTVPFSFYGNLLECLQCPGFLLYSSMHSIANSLAFYFSH